MARAAGVTRPLVYTLFDDFDGLLDALADREEGRALGDLEVALAAFVVDEDPDAALARGVRLFLDGVRAQPDRWNLILMPPDGTPARLRARIERNRAAILTRLEDFVRWGLERRGGPPGLDAELLARMILTLAQETARLVLTHPRRYSNDRILSFTTAALAAVERGQAA